MSHITDWACRSCRAVIGRVRDGVLRPIVPVESVDGWGVARVPCLTCGRVRTWAPAGGSRPANVLRRPVDRASRSERRTHRP